MEEDRAIFLTKEELHKASAMYMPFRSYHEGYAIVKEELDELWDEIKNTHYNRYDGKNEHNEDIKKEAIQVSAMILRFLVDLC